MGSRVCVLQNIGCSKSGPSLFENSLIGFLIGLNITKGWDMADSTERFLKDIKDIFSLTAENARGVMVRFHREMELGLSGEKSSLKMLPSFVHRPKGTEKGTFLAIDLGGTNIRVLAIRLLGDGVIEPVALSRFTISDEVMTGTGDMFFDFIAGCIEVFFRENNITKQPFNLGFTFSFPVVQSSVNSGLLISWTKGFSVSGVEGKDVVALLNDALIRNRMGFIHISALINDTVGTIAAGSYSNPLCDMGVILGTGTNACYPEKIDKIGKYSGSDALDEMIINIEWGGFDKLERNRYDEALEVNSQNPGEQRLEKMVSGMYLGEIARLIIIDMIEKGLIISREIKSLFMLPYSLTTKHLSLFASGIDIFKAAGVDNLSDKDIRCIREIANLVSTRSARIAATAIASVVTWMDHGLQYSHHIAIDGSLFEKYPGYKDIMESMFHEILGDPSEKIRLVPTHDGSGTGAAIIAALESLKKR